MRKFLFAATLALALGGCASAPENRATDNAIAGVPPVIELRH